MSTFVWVPTYGSAVKKKPAVSVSKFGDGYEQRVALGINNNPRTWEVVFANRPNDTANAIAAFFDDAGAVSCFDWTPPRGNLTPGRWVCREWSELPTGPYTTTITATFEEVVA